MQHKATPALQRRSKRNHSESLTFSINEVITLAKDDFLKGTKNAKRFAKRIEIENEDKDKDDQIELTDDLYPAIRDNRFTRNANWISGTNFIASSGPKNNADLGRFFEDLIKHDIHHVIALGDCLYKAEPYRTGYDFLAYSIVEGKSRFGRYQVEVERKGRVEIDGEGEFRPRDVIQSKVTISQRKKKNSSTVTPCHQLDITIFELTDGTAFNLDDDVNDKKKEKLWELFQLSLTHPVAIHCRAGRGRTGHLIFIFEILKNYSDIFSSNDPKTIAAKLHELLNRIRSERPSLVHTERQFTQAIFIAHLLHEFALKMGYIQAETLSSLKIPTKKNSAGSLGMFSRFEEKPKKKKQKNLSVAPESSVTSSTSHRNIW